ncbi:MAG: hypothetical protein AAB354_09975, partial [candidate division KSB1 bacterium]
EQEFLAGKTPPSEPEAEEHLGDAWRKDLLKIYGPVFREVGRRHNKARKNYMPKPYAGRITLFRNGDAGETPDYQRKWASLALGGLAVHTVPGDHQTILLEPHVRVLAQRLREEIEEALTE